MEIDLNKVDCTETSEFINFSIREYVAEIRSKDPKKCWPFGSLGDNEVFTSYEFTESTFLSSQNCFNDINGSDDTPEHIVAPNSLQGEINNGKEDRPEPTTDMVELLGNDDNLDKDIYNEFSEPTSSKVNYGQFRHENSVNDVAKIGDCVAVGDDKPGGNRLRKKLQKFRLLSDLLKDPASKLILPHCGTTNPENVNKRFFTETEEELDDNVTLNVLFRKQKGVKVTDLTLKKKKKKAIRVEELRVDQDVKSKHELKDLTGNDLQVAPGIHSRKKARIDDRDKQTMVKNKKDCGLPLISQKMNRYTKTAEMEAVMLLACRFNDDNPLTNKRVLSELKTNTSCACVQKKIRESSNVSVPKLIMTKSSKTETKNYADISLNMEDHPTRSVFQAHVEIFLVNTGGVAREAQNCGTLVCSVNKNPADFSTPNAENLFMRGG